MTVQVVKLSNHRDTRTKEGTITQRNKARFPVFLYLQQHKLLHCKWDVIFCPQDAHSIV